MGWLEALPCCPLSASPSGNNNVLPEAGLRSNMKQVCDGGKGSNPTKCRLCPSLPSASTRAQPPAPGAGFPSPCKGGQLLLAEILQPGRQERVLSHCLCETPSYHTGLVTHPGTAPLMHHHRGSQHSAWLFPGKKGT